MPSTLAASSNSKLLHLAEETHLSLLVRASRSRMVATPQPSSLGRVNRAHPSLRTLFQGLVSSNRHRQCRTAAHKATHSQALDSSRSSRSRMALLLAIPLTSASSSLHNRSRTAQGLPAPLHSANKHSSRSKTAPHLQIRSQDSDSRTTLHLQTPSPSAKISQASLPNKTAHHRTYSAALGSKRHRKLRPTALLLPRIHSQTSGNRNRRNQQ